jgi:hypothetical protein
MVSSFCVDLEVSDDDLSTESFLLVLADPEVEEDLP